MKTQETKSIMCPPRARHLHVLSHLNSGKYLSYDEKIKAQSLIIYLRIQLKIRFQIGLILKILVFLPFHSVDFY